MRRIKKAVIPHHADETSGLDQMSHLVKLMMARQFANVEIAIYL